jgi:hypothetical protein
MKFVNSLNSNFLILKFIKGDISMKLKAFFLELITILLLLFTFTLISFRGLLKNDINKVIIGDCGDSFLHLWNFWWIRKSLENGNNIFFTDYWFWPVGQRLYLHTLNIFWSAIYYTIHWYLTPIAAYNIFVLFAFLLNGTFMFLFLRQKTHTSLAF